MALMSPHCNKIYYTEVMADIKCDTFLPEFDTTKTFREIRYVYSRDFASGNGKKTKMVFLMFLDAYRQC